MTPASWVQLGYLAVGLGWMTATHHRWAEQRTLLLTCGPERWWQISYNTLYVLALAGWGLAWPATLPLQVARDTHTRVRG